jgi:hypothetical protein
MVRSHNMKRVLKSAQAEAWNIYPLSTLRRRDHRAVVLGRASCVWDCAQHGGRPLVRVRAPCRQGAGRGGGGRLCSGVAFPLVGCGERAEREHPTAKPRGTVGCGQVNSRSREGQPGCPGGGRSEQKAHRGGGSSNGPRRTVVLVRGSAVRRGRSQSGPGVVGMRTGPSDFGPSGWLRSTGLGAIGGVVGAGGR